jgi:hypothetical protein
VPHLRQRLRLIGRVKVPGIGRAHARDLDEHRIVTGLREMRGTSWFRVDAPGRQRLQRSFVKMIAIANVPSVRDDGRDPIVAMVMRLDRGVRGNRSATT